MTNRLQIQLMGTERRSWATPSPTRRSVPVEEVLRPSFSSVRFDRMFLLFTPLKKKKSHFLPLFNSFLSASLTELSPSGGHYRYSSLSAFKRTWTGGRCPRCQTHNVPRKKACSLEVKLCTFFNF